MEEVAQTPVPGPGAARASPAGRRLVLASRSPRRRELMAALRPSADQIAPERPEPPRRSGESPEGFVTRLSLAKASEVSERAGDAVVIGADTAVVLGGDVLGKPAGPEDATAMLRRLRAKSHRVVTGLTVLDSASGVSRMAYRTTDVHMRPYVDEEIAAYVASGEPLDKAGGYAVQDAAFRPAESVDGCYLNVVGLPLCEVLRLLDETGVATEMTPGWRPPADCDDCPLSAPAEVGAP